MTEGDLNIERLRRCTGVKWASYGAEVLPAWVADMDFPIAAPIASALAAAVANSDLGYPPAYHQAGLADLFAARAAERYGWPVQTGQIEFFSDVVQAIYLGLLTLCERGEGVLIQTPIYPPFLHAVAETARRPVVCPLVQGSGGYTIDFDALHGCVDPSTRILLFCHPHNPTGRAFTRAELEGIAEFALAHDLAVISDEIHADLMLDERAHIPLATLGPEIAARTITLTSASKAFNVAGLCLACGVFGSEALRARFNALPPHVRGGRSAFGMAAMRAAWSAGQPWLDGVLAQLRRNRATLARHVATQWPGIRCFPPQATYLAWLDCRQLDLREEPHGFFLRHARVALSEGLTFGAAGQGCVRLNFATSPAILDEILARMTAALAAQCR